MDVEHGSPSIEELTDWLEADDAKSRPRRAKRLQRLLRLLPIPPAGWFVHGGIGSTLCFDEIRRCYLDGSDMAVVLLCLAYVERELAAQLYAAGWEPAKKAPLSAVLEKAYHDSVLSQSEWRIYRELSRIRNSHAHFRAPLTPTTLGARSGEQNTLPEQVLARDATRALKALSRILRRQTSPSLDFA